VAGNLSDRIGRRPLITTTLFVRSGFIALLGTQVLLDAPLWTLGANMVVTSTLRGCFEPVAYALVADVATDDQRVAAFGVQRMGTNVGWAVGPAIGGLLTRVIPYGAVFYLAAAGSIVAAFVTLRVKDPGVAKARDAGGPAAASAGGTAASEAGAASGAGAAASGAGAASRDGGENLWASLVEALTDRVMVMLMVGTFLCALLETQMFSTFSIFMTEKLQLTTADVGLLYACNGLFVLVLQVPALGLIRRMGIRVMLPWSSLLDTLGFALIGLATGFAGGALSIVVLTCAEVLFDPAQQAAIAEVADPAHRGRAFGVVGFASMIGIALAPLLGGLLLDAIGDHHLMMWGAIALIGCGQTACFIVFVRRRVEVRPLAAA